MTINGLVDVMSASKDLIEAVSVLIVLLSGLRKPKDEKSDEEKVS
jgi:hypothetical protein